MFHPTISFSLKNFLFQKILMTSLHVICGLDLLQSKILEKPFRRPFFWKTLAAVSLALSIPVLGFVRVCPRKDRPWPRIFFCVLGLGLEPYVLDSTSESYRLKSEILQ